MVANMVNRVTTMVAVSFMSKTNMNAKTSCEKYSQNISPTKRACPLG